MEIFCFSGKAGSGKDFLARAFYLMLPPTNTIFMSLADILKLDTIVKDGVDRNKVYGQKDRTSRLALQKRGTEEGRMKYGEDIWIKYTYERMLQYKARGVKRFFITDIRFPNELLFFKSLGAHVFRVIAPQRSYSKLVNELGGDPESVAQAKLHISETALDDPQYEKEFTLFLPNDPGQSGVHILSCFAEKYLSLTKRVVFFISFDMLAEQYNLSLFMEESIGYTGEQLKKLASQGQLVFYSYTKTKQKMVKKFIKQENGDAFESLHFLPECNRTSTMLCYLRDRYPASQYYLITDSLLEVCHATAYADTKVYYQSNPNSASYSLSTSALRDVLALFS